MRIELDGSFVSSYPLKMADWMGLDSGGTEQLWDPEVLFDILSAMKRHEPFSRVDPQSPIFEDLELQYPDMTWLNVDRSDGSLRPIFRKVNPIVKLGLTTPETNDAYVTELGMEVLSGDTKMEDVFVLAAKAHEEDDGTKSMVQMCKVALRMPRHEFSLADVEFGISKIADIENSDLEEQIADVRSKSLRVSGSTRPRRIRSFLNTLVRAGALAQTDNGWILNSAAQAQEIAQEDGERYVELERVTSAAAVPNRRLTNFSKLVTAGRGVASFDLSRVSKADPVKAALALERANQLHEEIVGQLGRELEGYGFTSFEDSDSFDLAILEIGPSIYEVKTINAKNVISQIRKAIVQLEEYRWRHLDAFEAMPKLFIALSQNPTGHVDPHYFDFIEADRGITVIWPEPDFVDRHGQALPAILGLQS